MKMIDFLRFSPAIIFCVASVAGWLLGKDGTLGFALAGVFCYLVALDAT